MLDSKTDNNDIYKGLNELYKAGKYEETIENIQNCGIDLEEDPSLMNLKGACYTRLGEYEKAISSLMDTLSIDPDNKYALINLATIKFIQKSYQLSFNYYAKAAQDSEIEPRYLANMGICLFKLDHFDDAINIINNHEFGNGTSIYTSNGTLARNFMKNVQIGMVGINVPIPVPMAFYSFGGWKGSIFGGHGMHGEEGINFYTKRKTITSRWPEDVAGASLNMPTMK